MGVRLSIDDFGTGYSSLAYLKKLPVDELKIDRSFVTHLDRDAGDATIVRSTIELAHNLGLRVVAEGIETDEVRQRLIALGCDEAQGYWFSRPVSADDFWAWMHRLAPPDDAHAASAGRLHLA
jgi:EAL domain-containing protein (putative c-di-GMP-specific phosphodiesterase class I)